MTLIEREDVEFDESDLRLRALARKYHKLYTCYKWKYKRNKRAKLGLSIASGVLIAAGVVIEVATANPIPMALVSGAGVVLGAYVGGSNVSRKVEMCKFAYTTYKKSLALISQFISGVLPYNEALFMSDMLVIDGIVDDLCPTINGMSKKYDNMYRKNGMSIDLP